MVCRHRVEDVGSHQAFDKSGVRAEVIDDLSNICLRD
ncbi:hypothetical protein X772_28165 [Mesorhizobium sp. LSJC280B00]|nr:hypothetical protein X772_28165 [Mesorhizobium sp. LSJC280B00]